MALPCNTARMASIVCLLCGTWIRFPWQKLLFHAQPWVHLHDTLIGPQRNYCICKGSQIKERGNFADRAWGNILKAWRNSQEGKERERMRKIHRNGQTEQVADEEADRETERQTNRKKGWDLWLDHARLNTETFIPQQILPCFNKANHSRQRPTVLCTLLPLSDPTHLAVSYEPWLKEALEVSFKEIVQGDFILSWQTEWQ